MNGHVEGIVRESGLSPDLIHTISKDLADGIFLKLLKKDFKDGSYYRTIIARMTAAQSTKAIAAASHKAIAAKVRTSARAELLFSYTLHSCAHPSCIRQGKQKQGKQSKQGKQGSPDACICMARVRGLELELTCLVTPTPDEEFQLGLISQNMAFRVRETSIRLACTNLEQIMRRVAGLTFKSGGVAEGKPPGMSLVQLEEGSDVEIVGLVGAAKHNGRRGTVGSYDAEKQRYAVSLPACRSPAAAAAATAAGGDGKRMAAQKIAVKASNLLPLTMPVPSSGGEDAGEITATLWSIESKGSLSMVSLSPLSALNHQPSPSPSPSWLHSALVRSLYGSSCCQRLTDTHTQSVGPAVYPSVSRRTHQRRLAPSHAYGSQKGHSPPAWQRAVWISSARWNVLSSRLDHRRWWARQRMARGCKCSCR
jgi:hypothetical protein